REDLLGRAPPRVDSCSRVDGRPDPLRSVGAGSRFPDHRPTDVGRVALGSATGVVATTCRHARTTRCPGRAAACGVPGMEFPGATGWFVVVVPTTGGDEYPARGRGRKRGPAGGARPAVRRARRVGEV